MNFQSMSVSRGQKLGKPHAKKTRHTHCWVYSEYTCRSSMAKGETMLFYGSSNRLASPPIVSTEPTSTLSSLIRLESKHLAIASIIFIQDRSQNFLYVPTPMERKY